MSKMFLALGLLALPSAVLAQSSSGSFKSETSVPITCKVVSAQNVNFGVYDPFSASDLIQMPFASVQCTSTKIKPQETFFKIKYSEGLHADSTSTCDNPKRRLRSKDDGNYLNYRIGSYDGSKSFGCGSESTETSIVNTFSNFHSKVDEWWNRPNNQKVTNISPFAVVPAGQNAAIGSYEDTITILIEF